MRLRKHNIPLPSDDGMETKDQGFGLETSCLSATVPSLDALLGPIGMSLSMMQLIIHQTEVMEQQLTLAVGTNEQNKKKVALWLSQKKKSTTKGKGMADEEQEQSKLKTGSR